jgi:hypothetical protein
MDRASGRCSRGSGRTGTRWRTSTGRRTQPGRPRPRSGAGAGVIYQGTLTGAGEATTLLGRPDFLVRADPMAAPDGEARPGGRHYEVVDAKLARTAKARAVLQTAFYSRLLAELQGIEPRWMHLALGHGEFVSFKVRDFAAYERQTRRRLVEVLGAGPPPGLYPEPVEHCEICRWSELCSKRRRDDDELSLVAGLTTGQRRALKAAGTATRRGFAAAAELPRLDRVSRDSLDRARSQARLQGGHLVSRRGAARPGIPLLPAPAERGDLAGQGDGHHRGQPRPHPGVLPDTAPDDPGERPVPGLGRTRLILTGRCRPVSRRPEPRPPPQAGSQERPARPPERPCWQAAGRYR